MSNYFFEPIVKTGVCYFLYKTDSRLFPKGILFLTMEGIHCGGVGRGGTVHMCLVRQMRLIIDTRGKT